MVNLQAESWLKTQQLDAISADDMLHLKQRGFSDAQIARFTCELLICARRDVNCCMLSERMYGQDRW